MHGELIKGGAKSRGGRREGVHSHWMAVFRLVWVLSGLTISGLYFQEDF